MSARWMTGLAAVAVVVGGAPGAAAQVRATYAPAQALAGRTAYAQSCAECHRDDMTGSFEAPPLAGAAFLGFWGGRPIEELTEMASLMPPRAEGSLGEETYTSIVAAINNSAVLRAIVESRPADTSDSSTRPTLRASSAQQGTMMRYQ